MNSVDMMQNLIHRAKHLKEFIVTTTVPDNFRFNGLIPFDMKINGDQLEAKVYALDFDEAAHTLNEYLETCK